MSNLHAHGLLMDSPDVVRCVVVFDLIIVMVNGTVAEQGTHAQLLVRPNSTYSRMWAQQRYGDEKFYEERGAPEWCDYVPLVPDVDLVPEPLTTLADSRPDTGWLW